MWGIQDEKANKNSWMVIIPQWFLKYGERIFKITTTLLGLTITGCILWSIILLFRDARSIEYICLSLTSASQFINFIILMIIARRQSHVLCLVSLIISTMIILYIIILAILTIKKHVYLNPLEYVTSAAVWLFLLHVVLIIATVNYLRILHREKPNWIAAKIFGGMTTEIQKNPKIRASSETSRESDVTVKSDSFNLSTEQKLSPGAIVVIPQLSSKEDIHQEYSKVIPALSSEELRLPAGYDNYPREYNPFDNFYPEYKNPFNSDYESYSFEPPETHYSSTDGDDYYNHYYESEIEEKGYGDHVENTTYTGRHYGLFSDTTTSSEFEEVTMIIKKDINPRTSYGLFSDDSTTKCGDEETIFYSAKSKSNVKITGEKMEISEEQNATSVDTESDYERTLVPESRSSQTSTLSTVDLTSEVLTTDPPSVFLMDIQTANSSHVYDDYHVSKTITENESRRKMEYMFPYLQYLTYESNNNIDRVKPIAYHKEEKSSGNQLRRTPSVLLEKSLLPIPEYLEKADFLEKLPCTRF